MHNCEFEQSFLGKYLGETTWICTYKCALRVWPHLISHSNQAPRDYLERIASGQNDLREDVKFSARYWLAQMDNS